MSDDTIRKIMQSKEFWFIVNICRILLVILAAAILFVLIKEIEAVKLLAYDPCQICMNKTGAFCFYPRLLLNS